MRFRALGETISPLLATAVGISVASHLAVYGLTPVLSLHLVALGSTSTDVGLVFSVFSLVAVVLRPAAGAWIDRQGVLRALLPGAALTVLSSLGFQAATGPRAFIALMAGFGVGYGLTTMAAAVLAASAPPERRGRALSVYYLAAPVSMAVAAPLGLWLFREVGAGANFAMVTVLALAAAACGLSPGSAAGRRMTPAPGARPLWSRNALPLSVVLAVAAMGQSALYAFLPLHATASGAHRHRARRPRPGRAPPGHGAGNVKVARAAPVSTPPRAGAGPASSFPRRGLDDPDVLHLPVLVPGGLGADALARHRDVDEVRAVAARRHL